MTRIATLVAGLMMLAALPACTRLTVDSNPPGAAVLWSEDGLNFKSWPPNSFEASPGKAGEVRSTPLKTTGIYGDAVFITVEKEGYLRPLPKPVQLYAMRKEKLSFDLVETPETLASRMKAKGLLFYKGEWVDPKQHDLVERSGVTLPRAEAFKLDQIAKGLIEYEGQWLTPADAFKQEAQDKSAAGFIRFKDRWVKPEVAAAESQIDDTVKALASTKTYPDLPAPKVIGTTDFPETQLQLFNSTGAKARFLFSGPRSVEYVIDPYKSLGIRSTERILLPPGRYDIAIIPITVAGEGETPGKELWGSWPLSASSQYSLNYFGTEGSISDTLKDFKMPDVDINIDAPKLDFPGDTNPSPTPTPTVP